MNIGKIGIWPSFSLQPDSPRYRGLANDIFVQGFFKSVKNMKVEIPLHIQHEEKNSKPASPSTVANWVKEVMALAGINTTQFKAHSTSTKAYMTGIGVPKLKKHVNWSLCTDTFERYYLRPP
ncbi:hypothetical protein G6F70_006255 [Rhizopus microsporus]|nr:hypothetical protein G6F71_006173 [Rhizopus microsporus]KAG1197904.1 hypothetical protein G6F70_006255 [Rhizopus microsporus]KAG1209671.1 hypothetical protein G6F69_006152 [Rhizopus microsporus]KAG1231183.1 hypothetical protein G6F67_005934 [Rhizopus microsporus]